MSAFKTLKELQKKVEKNTGDGGGRFFSLKAGDSQRIRFLQELAEDGTNFSEKEGTALVVAVHANPDNYRQKLACTADDEKFGFRCWACEQSPDNPKWRPMSKLLVNIAVQDENGNWTVKLFEQGFGKAHVANDLVEYASAYGSITDRTYKITRSGSGLQDTQYTLIPLEQSKPSKDLDDADLFALDFVYNKIPYAEQEEFFSEFASESDPSKSW